MAGRYRKLGPIGVGGMARVFLAQDERLGRRVAIKQLHAESPDEAAERFDREAKLGASLNHPNLVSIYDVATDSESVLIVMEYVEGKTLKDAIDAGPLELAKVVSIIHDVAAALNHAHAHGIVHRDVKPANILLRHDGMTKLADLGIATAAASTSITRSGMVLGTASYMAPEQLDGQKAGPASDIYSLAAVAFEAVSGRKAMTGETPMEIAHKVISSPPPDLREAWPDAPAGAAEAISRGMSRKPGDRPASAGEFATALHRGLRGAKGVAAVVPAAAGAAGAGIAAAGRPADPADAPPTPEPAAAAPTPEPAGAAPTAEPAAHPADGAAPTPPPERAAHRVTPQSAARRDRADAPPAPASTYRRTRGTPSWLPAAGAVAALCVIAVVAFSVFGGGGDDAKTSDGADKASQSDGGTADGKSDSAKAGGDDDGGSSSGAASGAGSSSGSASGQAGGSGQSGGASAGAAGSTSQTSSGGTSASALNDRGFKLMNQGRYNEAIPPLEKAVSQFPEGSKDLTYAFALYNLGRSLRLAGRPKEAVPILEKRLRIPNQTATVRNELEAARRAAG